MRHVLLVLAISACHQAQPTASAPAAPAVPVAAPAPGGVHLGEAIVDELPANTAVYKLHADRSPELLLKSNTSEKWIGGPPLKPDGSIEANGNVLARVVDHGTYNAGDPERGGTVVTVEGDRLTFHTKGLADATATFAGNQITLAGDRT